MTEAPILCVWSGEEMRPASRYWASRADEQFVVGERYAIEVQRERSYASHRAYFASLGEAWANLPDHLAERLPSVEALRKYALIQTGYRDERSIVCSSKAEAARLAAFIRPMDDFAIVSVSEAVVVVQTAKSQSFRAMGKQVFQRSKDDVLNYVASLIGVPSETLQREGRAA